MENAMWRRELWDRYVLSNCYGYTWEENRYGDASLCIYGEENLANLQPS